MGNVGATANPVAAPFTWTGIESSLSAALDKATPASTADGLAQDRLNYLRGDRSKDGNPFRVRTHLLGDIINSGVVYSGAPSKAVVGSTAYSTFLTTNASRTPAIFVGANDGMLHAFNATDGEELFAYIPSWVAPNLPALTNAGYATTHKSFVDATPAVAEAQVGSTWKTVLISGTGAGGKGVFALDVTTPASFTKDNVMWEFTQTDDADMGNVIGRPQILKMRTSAYGSAATYKWFAVVGSGVNNYVPDGAGIYGRGYPALFLLDLSKPAGTAWALGANYYKISLPVNGNQDYLTGSTALTATKATGLINFSAALGAAREVTQMFMGDLHGNLWKLDFSLVGATNWNINKLSYFNKGTIALPLPYPMYIAKDAATTPNTQPITMAPTIAYGPLPDTNYVLFGTGKYLEASDKTSTTQQSFYMIYDNAKTSADDSPAGASAISGRGRLQQGTVTTSTGVVSVPAFTLGRPLLAGDLTKRSGWYFDYPVSMERQISNATVVGDAVSFGSLIPGASASSGTCSALPGSGNIYTLSMTTGNGSYTISNVGISGEPLVTELRSATSYSAYGPSDMAGQRIKTITTVTFQQGSGGISVGTTSTRTVRAGRLSWREIYNYQDLKNTP